MPAGHRAPADALARLRRVRHHRRRALRERVRRGPAAGRRQLAVAQRRRARARRHRVQAGLAVRGAESAARRWWRATSPRTSSARCSTSRKDWTAAGLLLARRQAQRRARDWCSSQIGFRVHVLEGGYRAYRRAVIAALDDAAGALRLPRRLRPHRLGQEPAARRRWPRAGAQVLDLEALANHRGSVLGLVPGSRSRRRRSSTRASGMRCAASIRRGRCSSRARARRSATCASPRR